METIIIKESDFNINNQNSIDEFSNKLYKIEEPFEVKFDYPITKIPAWLFHRTNLTKITIPDSVTQIGAYAFNQCVLLTEITLPNTITKIHTGAFTYCESLTKITVPDSVIEIGSHAFDNCKFLIEITLPNSIIAINLYAFADCQSLTEITIPSSIKSLGSDIFLGCTSLKQITIQMPEKDFLEKVKGAQNFLDEYEDIISFEEKSINEKSIDELLIKNNSLESIISFIEPEH